MFWVFVAALAYFFFALGSLFDRYLLAGSLLSPKAYAFYVGAMGILALILIPFGFIVPDLDQVFLSLLAGGVWIWAVFLLYRAISKSEVSRVVPAVGGLLPIFTLLIVFVFSSQKINIDFSYIFALILLILGSILITFEKGISFQNIKNAAEAAFLFSWGFFLMKRVYEVQPFISGFVWMRIGGALASPIFLVSKKARRQIFVQKSITKTQVSLPLITAQIFGGLGFALQNYSVYLAEISQVPLINALEGIRYVFLLLFIFVLGKRLPHLLKEKASKTTLLQKIVAILLIEIGLVFLALK
jgi:hypothetical protein